MKKKILVPLALSLIFAIVLSSACFADTQPKGVTIFLTLNNPFITVNTVSTQIDTAPINYENRVFAPIRAVIEAIGGKVSWDQPTQKVTLAMPGKKIELWIGKKEISVSGVKKAIDVAPIIKDGRTLLPVRFAVEDFGCNVSWDGDMKRVTVVYNPSSENSSSASIKGVAVTAKAGQQVSYVVKASSIKNLGKFIVDINFDPAKLTPKSVTQGNMKSTDYINQYGETDFSNAASGTISVISSDDSAVKSSDGDLFTVVFDVKPGVSGTTAIKLKPEIYDSTTTLIPVQVDAGSITIN